MGLDNINMICYQTDNYDLKLSLDCSRERKNETFNNMRFLRNYPKFLYYFVLPEMSLGLR